MYEQSKLKEAGYFYSRMASETDNRDNLLFDLSAFLSAARSVLQYALNEAQTKSGGQQWYDNHMKSSEVLAFFKDKRDINVHVHPIQVNQHASVQLTEVLHLSESIHIKQFDRTGRLIDEYSSEPSKPPAAPEIPPKVMHRFTFPGWSGTEDVFQLCHLYLSELQRVVQDGQNNGF
ncbi:MAG: hypothetical protein ACP5KD_09155 [Fervidobacterium sp.]